MSKVSHPISQREAAIPGVPSARSARGRKRSDLSREAILKATNELLEEVGFDKLSIEGIAARAGVGKTTIYRWWTSKGTLAIEAFLSAVAPQIAFPHTRSAVADIKAQIPRVAQVYRGRVGRILRELIALGQTDPQTRRLFVEGYLEPRRSATKQVLQRAIEQGELRADINLDVLVDALYGPLFHRMLTGHAALNDTFVRDLVDLVLGSASKPTREQTSRLRS